MNKIIDISTFNDVTNWDKVKQNVAGVIIRIGYRGYGNGAIKEDARFRSHVEGAVKAGIPMGFYFMSQAMNRQEGIEEADYCYERIKDMQISLPVFFDSEYSSDKKNGRADYISKEERTWACLGFCERLKQLGIKAGVYASKSWFTTHLVTSLLTDYYIWCAQYNNRCTAAHRVDLWQYTSKGTIPGIAGNVDINECYVSFTRSDETSTQASMRQKVVEIARNWIGYSENDGSHKEIIDVYNSHKPLARGYAVKYADAWCATFGSAVAIRAGLTDIIPTECGCEKQIDLFKKIGSWVEDDGYVPAPGDYIFYDWQDNGKGDDTGWSDHVGIVEFVSGTTIMVIEGNKDNAVGRREIQINEKCIRGYGVPKYADESDKKDANDSSGSNTDLYWLSAADAWTKEDAEAARRLFESKYPGIPLGLRKANIANVEVLD